MKTNCKLNRQLARENGIEERCISVYTEQQGYGRQRVFVQFNSYYYGDIEDLPLCTVFPNINEHFDNLDAYNEQKLSYTELIISIFSDEICDYLEAIEDEE